MELKLKVLDDKLLRAQISEEEKLKVPTHPAEPTRHRVRGNSGPPPQCLQLGVPMQPETGVPSRAGTQGGVPEGTAIHAA